MIKLCSVCEFAPNRYRQIQEKSTNFPVSGGIRKAESWVCQVYNPLKFLHSSERWIEHPAKDALNLLRRQVGNPDPESLA